MALPQAQYKTLTAIYFTPQLTATKLYSAILEAKFHASMTSVIGYFDKLFIWVEKMTAMGTSFIMLLEILNSGMNIFCT